MRTLKRSLFVGLLLLLATGVGGAQPVGMLADRALAQEVVTSTVLVPYSAQLLDSGGQPVLDGVYELRLELYDLEDSEQPLWAEVQEQVPVLDGTFSVILGEQTPLPAAVMASGTRWLALAVRGPDEAEPTALSPRQALIPVQSADVATPAASPACAHDHTREWWDVGVVGDVARSGFGVEGSVTGGINAAAVIHVRNLAASGGGSGIIGEHLGSGPGVYAYSRKGPGLHAWSTEKEGVYATSAGSHAIFGKTTGDWGWISGVYGQALHEHANGVTGWNIGKGTGVYAYSEMGTALYAKGKEGNLIEAWDADPNDQRFRVTNAGEVYADGGYKGAADFAELMAVDDKPDSYEPGDVLVISDTADRGVALSDQPYSTSVIGVYSEQPGFLGSAHPMEEQGEDEIAVAMVGIVSCKVTAENGAIKRGDLLVTSATTGHAMRGEDPAPGTILGKALEPLDSGAGTIQIAVMLQ